MRRPDLIAKRPSGGDEPIRLAGSYRAVFEALSTPSLVVAPPDFVMVAANDARLRMTNTHREDVIGRRLFDVFHNNPDDPEATGVANLRASLERVVTSGRTDVMAVQKYDIPRPGGGFEERWWTPVNIPVHGDDGAVRYIIHQVDDVTTEMRERRQAIDAEAGAARFREVADAIPGLVFETDLRAKNTYVNRHCRAYTGLPFEALLGDGWRQAVHPDDRERTVAAWLEAIRTGRPFGWECRIRRADGAWRWFKVRASLLRGAHDGVGRAIGVCTDIDDAKRGEAAIREARRLHRTLPENVSRRLENGLALVSSLLQLQARAAETSARQALEEALMRVHAVARVHDQLRRCAADGDIDLAAFLSGLCSNLASASPGHTTTCRIDPATVGADLAVPLGVLLNELLTNAFKHAYPDGQGGEVRLRGTLQPDGRYRLEVRDFGRGLPAGFDPSMRRKSLGMRVITGLAAQLGGQLIAGSAGPGARFCVVFPPGSSSRVAESPEARGVG
jgi:PAS domain S-box-containing protein